MQIRVFKYISTTYFGKNTKFILVSISPSWVAFRYKWHPVPIFLRVRRNFLHSTQNFAWMKLTWLKPYGETLRLEAHKWCISHQLTAPRTSQLSEQGGQANHSSLTARSKKSHNGEMWNNNLSCHWGPTPSPLRSWPGCQKVLWLTTSLWSCHRKRPMRADCSAHMSWAAEGQTRGARSLCPHAAAH